MENITDYLKKAFEYKNECCWEKAIDYFYKALAIDNNSTEIISELAYIYTMLCKYDRACSLYEQIAALDPENNTCKFDLAVLYKKMKEYKKSDGLFSELYFAGFDKEKIEPYLSLKEAVENLYKTDVKKYVIANYTSLQPTRNEILNFNK